MPTQQLEIEKGSIYMVRSTPIGRDKRTWEITRRIHGFDLRNYSGWIDTTESPAEHASNRSLPGTRIMPTKTNKPLAH